MIAPGKTFESSVQAISKFRLRRDKIKKQIQLSQGEFQFEKNFICAEPVSQNETL